ncbi:MAG: hypothetical protein JNL21_36235 [Myxococcales bacterium]|nr:hypothetical protein [Myxococcales bacterium]
MTDERPFLPEPEPAAPTQQAQPSPRKTLLLWIVLIALFAAIWSLVGEDKGGTPPPEPSRFGGWWLGLLPSGLVFAFAVYFFRTYRQSIDFNLALEAGRRAMAERRFGDAARAFGEVAAAHEKQPLYSAAARSQTAGACLASGNLVEARRLYTELERIRSLVFTSSVRLQAAIQLGMTNALLGDLETAAAWTEEARGRLRKTKDDRLGAASLLCVVDAVIALRRGRRADALKLLESNWLLLREVLSANQMRVVEVIRSFAEASAVLREHNAVSARLVRIEPVQPGEFAYLGVAWPEMKTFLDAHGLG